MALTTEKKIYVALGVLALTAGGFYIQQRSVAEEMAKHAPGALAASLPEIKLSAEDVEQLTRLEIRNADKGEVVLEKKDGTWVMTKPVSYPAHQQNVKSLLDNLKELKLKDTIDPGEAQYATYELDDEKSLHVVAYKGSDKALDLYFGKSGSRGQMTRMAAQPGVYIAGGYSSYLYTRETKSWRDNEILKLDDTKVVSVEIKNENGVFVFSKSGDDWSGTFKGQKFATLDGEKVKDLLRAYKTLNADDFADDKSDAETGLEKPLATLKLTLEGEGGSHTLLVGGTVEESKSHYAKTAGGTTTFVIGSWVADWATAAKSKFEKGS